MPPRRKREWFDDAAFWVESYPFMFPAKRFADASDQAKKILKLTRPRGKSVLDLCCGPGRFSILLAKKGFAVTGVDSTRFLLNKARGRARAARARVEWVLQDMRDFVRPGAFHLVLNLFTSFGYFDDKQEDVLVLRNIFASLKPGGVLLIDVMGKERLARILSPTTSEVLPDGTMLVQRHQIFDDWTRIRNEWMVIRNGKSRSFKFHHTIYSGQELKALLAQVGFRGIKLYGNLAGEPYGPDAARLIAVARKPSR
jgi:SAM-dependent methyltransferase